jgi:hypothetical protein
VQPTVVVEQPGLPPRSHSQPEARAGVGNYVGAVDWPGTGTVYPFPH